MTGYISITVTAANKAEAAQIAEALVTEKLAACVNIIPHVTSFYRWKGKIEEAEEAVLFIKTRAELFGTLSRRVQELHSYDNPCIVAEPIVAGTPEYLHWLGEETC